MFSVAGMFAHIQQHTPPLVPVFPKLCREHVKPKLQRSPNCT